jgi:hypothetical protein
MSKEFTMGSLVKDIGEKENKNLGIVVGFQKYWIKVYWIGYKFPYQTCYTDWIKKVEETSNVG